MDFEEKQKRLSTYAKKIAAPAGDFVRESFSPEANPMYGWIDQAQPSGEERDTARQAVDKVLREAPLTPRETLVFEAIVLPQGRPVLNVVNDRFDTPPAPWTHLGQADLRAHIEAAIPSIGRVEVPKHPSLPYAGTGFLVGDGILMTNRHVAELFTLGLGVGELRFRPGLDGNGVAFRREVQPGPPEFFEIRKVLLVHPYWDMALFQVDGLSNGRKPLTLEAIPAEDLRDHDVVVVGYPAQDPRNDISLQNRIFGGLFQVKRMQPGKLTGARNSESFGHTVGAMTHDSSTLGGNSGSALINPRTGNVVGLHFGGAYLDTNYAVPAYELSRDRVVVDAQVNFTETQPGDSPWKSYWDLGREDTSVRVAAVVTAQVVAAKPAEDRPRGTVEITIPLRISISLGPAVSGGGLSVTVDGPARATESLPYYDAGADKQARDLYYKEFSAEASPEKLFDDLHRLLEQTHKTKPGYQPSRWLYPLVDRQKDGRIRSLYSTAGKSFTLEEMLAMDEAVEQMRAQRYAELPFAEAMSSEAVEAIEAALPFNCEHTVPQSWFSKKEPMRGDLHHLFSCETRCNSFRGNNAYYSFSGEAVLGDCGQSEKNKFEPGAGKGAVSRATFYFLVRYPGIISALPADRLPILRQWHEANPVDDWEWHRCQAIFAIQGNRNPFIDFPDWARKVDFRRGLRVGESPEVLRFE